MIIKVKKIALIITGIFAITFQINAFAYVHDDKPQHDAKNVLKMPAFTGELVKNFNVESYGSCLALSLWVTAVQIKGDIPSLNNSKVDFDYALLTHSMAYMQRYFSLRGTPDTLLDLSFNNGKKRVDAGDATIAPDCTNRMKATMEAAWKIIKNK